MKEAELREVGEAFERLSQNPDYEFLKEGLQSQIQKVSAQILQGVFTKFPEDYWKATGELEGLKRTGKLIKIAIQLMKDQKKEEEKRAKK